MSYILEALKQSEQKRDDSNVPDLHAVQEAVPPRDARITFGRRSLAGVLLMLILLTGGLAGWWFGGISGDDLLDTRVANSPGSKPDTVVTGPAADHLAGQAASEATAIDPPLPAVQINEPQTQTAILQTAEIQTAETQTAEIMPVKKHTASEVPTSVELTSRATLLPQNQQNREAAVANPTAAKGQEQTASRGNDEAANAAVDVTVSKPPVVKASPALEDKRVELPSDKAEAPIKGQAEKGQAEVVEVSEMPELTHKLKPPHIRELPYDIQQKLPKITYSVHLYAAIPARRMVKINGRIRREGDEIVTDLILDEITPGGAVFTFREHRFRIPVN